MELNIDHCSIFRAFFAEFTQTQRISLLGDRKFICAPIRFSYSAPHRSKRKYRNTLTFFRRTNLYQKKKKKKETGTKKKKKRRTLLILCCFSFCRLTDKFPIRKFRSFYVHFRFPIRLPIPIIRIRFSRLLTM